MQVPHPVQQNLFLAGRNSPSSVWQSSCGIEAERTSFSSGLVFPWRIFLSRLPRCSRLAWRRFRASPARPGKIHQRCRNHRPGMCGPAQAMCGVCRQQSPSQLPANSSPSLMRRRYITISDLLLANDNHGIVFRNASGMPLAFGLQSVRFFDRSSRSLLWLCSFSGQERYARSTTT